MGLAPPMCTVGASRKRSPQLVRVPPKPAACGDDRSHIQSYADLLPIHGRKADLQAAL